MLFVVLEQIDDGSERSIGFGIDYEVAVIRNPILGAPFDVEH